MSDQQNAGLMITNDLLRKWSACSDGFRWFLARFPQGGDYCAVQAALRDDKRFDDARWLTDRAFEYAMDEPGTTRDIVVAFESEALELVSATAINAQTAADPDDSKIGSGGGYAQIGSGGVCAKIGSGGVYAQIGSSGDYAQIGSSGDYAQIGSGGVCAQIGSGGVCAKIGSGGGYAQIGSSGDYAQIGSSGDYAQINAEGSNAVVAASGMNTTVRAGEGGAVAVAYHDGQRVRFAVGYVGEGIKPLTWYSVNAIGDFVEIAS